MPEPTAVRTMFAGIAGRYDFANSVLSGGVDKRWRRRVVREARAHFGKDDLAGIDAIDLACGTGLLSMALERAGARTIGIDFTYPMLANAPRALESGAWIQGDALGIPARSSCVDLVTIAFGLRNVADRRAAFREMVRVLKPGGIALVLEFGMPDRDLFGRVYRGYLSHVLPRIGGVLAGDRAAYTYLDETVQGWPDAETLTAEMASDGFEGCSHQRLWRGIACLHRGVVPGSTQSEAAK